MEKYLSSLLREKWCLLVWTGAFHWIHCGPRDKDITLEGTDGPLSAQINQTQLTPSALSSKSHCLQWHLLLGAQLYNLVSPTRLSKAAICSTEVGTTEHSCHYSGLPIVRRGSVPHSLAGLRTCNSGPPKRPAVFTPGDTTCPPHKVVCSRSNSTQITGKET